MKWRNISFNRKDTAEECMEEMVKAGIKVGDIFLNDEYFLLPWMPMNKEEYEHGINIAFKHIF